MKYDWKDAGEEWSERWGTSKAQWSETILPRIKDCLPAITILEIGPGYGRWTEYLKDHCERLIVVDRAAECIDACRSRFAADPRITGYVNNGGSLDMIPDASVDFIFSFDVFVHINHAEVSSYAAEFARVLKPGGVGIVHHGTVGGARGGSRSNLTQDAMMDILRSRCLSVIESVDEWRDEGGLFNLDAYADRVTVFAKPIAV